MKFVPVFLLLGCRCGRPSSRGVLFSTDTNDLRSSNDDFEQKPKCGKVNDPIDKDWTRVCLTADECCSKMIQKSLTTKNDRYFFVCGCIPQGKDALGDKSHCCSGIVDKKGKCGCISPDQGNQNHLSKTWIPLKKTDCCFPPSSFPPDDSKRVPRPFFAKSAVKCGPRHCTSKDQSPNPKIPCCGSSESRTSGKKGFEVKSCNCIPRGVSTNSKLETVTENDCCSSSFTKGTKSCACIPGAQVLPVGAPETSCCQGKAVTMDGTSYCQTKACSLPHHSKSKTSNICCLEQDNTLAAYKAHTTTPRKSVLTCPCLKGGTTLLEDSHADYCCSGKADKKKCLFIDYDDKINPDIMTEEECFSGHAANAVCECMKPASNKRGKLVAEQAKQCCSNRITAAGTCACISSGNQFRSGANATDCCSKLGSHVKCLCGPVGTPFSKTLGMLEVPDCCTGKEAGGVCACRATGARAQKNQCCGMPDDNNRCACVKDKWIVPNEYSANPEAVCCSKASTHELDDQGCKVKVCGKKSAK